jgi:3-isopropylmalate/(R)-2-methylmalate dehydratase small subunit
MKVTGTAIKFSDNIDTDVILPGKYLVLIDPKDLAKHAMEGLDPAFPEKAAKGVIVVGGKNFGCGSSRNIGLPVIECKGISAAVDDGDDVAVDFETGKVQNVTKGTSLQAPKLPPFIVEILADGGLIENLRKRLNKK